MYAHHSHKLFFFFLWRRHLPALARAVKDFEGAVVLVSHDSHFVQDAGVDTVIDMGKELKA